MLLDLVYFFGRFILRIGQLLLKVQLQIEQLLDYLIVQIFELFVWYLVDAVDLVGIVGVNTSLIINLLIFTFFFLDDTRALVKFFLLGRHT